MPNDEKPAIANVRQERSDPAFPLSVVISNCSFLFWKVALRFVLSLVKGIERKKFTRVFVVIDFVSLYILGTSSD